MESQGQEEKEMTGFKILFTLTAAVFLISSGLFAAATTRKNNGETWEKKAEDSFYLNPGLAEKVLTKNLWERYEQKMNNLPPDQLSSFRVDMHKMLMQEARDKHIEVPPVSTEHGKHVPESQAGVSFKRFDTKPDARLLLVAGPSAGTGDFGKPPGTDTQGQFGGDEGMGVLGGGSTSGARTPGTAQPPGMTIRPNMQGGTEIPNDADQLDRGF
jgi:hypothetical protein